MISEAVMCDVCGAHKGEVNHWYLVIEAVGGITILPWDDAMAKQAKHVCGQKCAHKLLNEFFERRAA